MARILFITNQLPYPPVSGGTIKSWKLVEWMATRHELSVCTFLKGSDAQHEAAFYDAVTLHAYYSEPIDIPRSPLNLLRSYILRIPLNLYRNRSSSFREHVEQMIPAHDIVFIDHYEMNQYVPINCSKRIVLHQHNAEYKIWEGFAAEESSPVRRLFAQIEARRIQLYEAAICRRADAILAAPNDAEHLSFPGVDKSRFFDTYHLGDEELLDLPLPENSQTEQHLLYVGTLTWEANIDGLLWFITNAWEALKARHPHLQWNIVGRDPDKRLLEAVAANPDIHLPGFVDNLEPFYAKSQAFVCPLRYGSGIKVKVVNAMYRGVPVVTTPTGAEGLDVTSNHMAVETSPIAMADAISALLNDPDLRHRRATRARELARERYSWDYVFEQLERALRVD